MSLVNDGTDAFSGRRFSDFKALYGKIEQALGRFEQIEDRTRLLDVVMHTLVSEFKDELGFEMGRLYERDGEDFYLRSTSGGIRPVSLGFKVPRDYPPHVKTLEKGLLIMERDDPGYDQQFEWAIGVTSTFAAIAVGPGATHVLAFSVNGDVREEHLLYSLSAVRHVINLKLEERKLAHIIDEARIIQESLLPRSSPESTSYEIHGRSRPAEVVGGDFFDYITCSEDALGVAIGDASGHGLPAALLARDAITGFRMGKECGVGVVETVQRLNRVIHHAELSSNFISLFYCEFESDGSFNYCNAGHNPPVLMSGGELIQLRRGGLVLGPDPSAEYCQDRMRMMPGDVLVLYTDGIIEAAAPDGEQFGMDRLNRIIKDSSTDDSHSVVSRIFEAVDSFVRGSPQSDDMTVVVIRRSGIQ